MTGDSIEKLTDRELLDRVLRFGDLTESQRRIFQRWYDDLTRGALKALPGRDRLWVEGIYQQQDIARNSCRPRCVSRRAPPPWSLAPRQGK